MTEHDPLAFDWSPLSEAWRAEPAGPLPDPAELRGRIAHETRRMRRWLVVEVALSVVAAGASAWALAFRRSHQSSLFALDTLGMLALVWAFALWSRRGAWRPLSESTEAYVALARRRMRMRVRTAWFILGVLALQLAVVVLASAPAIGWAGSEGAPGGRLLPGAVTLGFLAWAVWLERSARRW